MNDIYVPYGKMSLSTARELWKVWKLSHEGQSFLSGNQEFVNGSPLGVNWHLFARLNKQDTAIASAMLLCAMQRFMVAPSVIQTQEYTTPGDFPAEVLSDLTKYSTGNEGVDVAWREMFDIKDYTNSNQGGFLLSEVTSGLAFRKISRGDKIEVYPIAGEEVTVNFNLYGGALGWDRAWFEDRDYMKIADIAGEFRNRYYNNMALAHYELIEALPSDINQAWVASPGYVPSNDPFYQVIKDISTINAACANILAALEPKGMDISVDETFFVLAPYDLRQRIGSALVTNYRPANAKQPLTVNYPVSPLYTKQLSADDVYYVVLPKRNIQMGIRKRLEMISDFDILSRVETTAAWGRYAAGIGEQDQLKRCATSGGVETVDNGPELTQALEYDGSGNAIYIGESLPGTLQSAAGWRIRKVTYDGSSNPTDVKWADSVQTFTKIWDSRATYTFA